MLKAQLKTLKKRQNHANRHLRRNKKCDHHKKLKSEINHENIITMHNKVVRK